MLDQLIVGQRENQSFTTKEKLNQIARDYHANPGVSDKFIEDSCQLYAAKWIIQEIREKDSRVLEMGYGDGLITAELAKALFHLDVVEGAPLLVDEVNRKFEGRVDCHFSLFEEFEPKEKYDAVVASHILEHVEDPRTLLKKIRTWIAPQGKLIVIVPNRESIHRQLAVLMGLQPELSTLSPRDRMVGHQRVYSLETLTEDLAQSGFEVLDSRGFFLKTLPNSMMLSYSAELIDALNRVSDLIPKQFLANLGLVAKISN